MINGQTEIKTNYATVITMCISFASFLIAVIMFTTTIDHWFEKFLAGISWIGIGVTMFISAKQLIDLERAQNKNIKPVKA